MSNPTTPFNWQMPTATDLVTDLPADFEVFGQAVATSMSDLLGGTTGQILSKASNTNMDFTWTSANPGDITGVTAGVGISGGGTSGDVTVTNSMATAITTSGDLIQGTGSGTFARLGSGTNGQFLTTNGTTLSWGSAGSGNLVQIATGSVSGTSLTLSGLSSYSYIMVQYFGITMGTSPSSTWRLNADSSALYNYNTSAAVTSSYNSAVTNVDMGGGTSGEYSATIELTNTKTTGFTSFRALSQRSGSTWFNHVSGIYKANSAISSVVVTFNSTVTGGTYFVYGA